MNDPERVDKKHIDLIVLALVRSQQLKPERDEQSLEMVLGIAKTSVVITLTFCSGSNTG